MGKEKKVREMRYCQFCGKELVRKQFKSGRYEDLSVYAKRKYCDRVCMRKGFVKIGSDHEQNYRTAHETAQKMAELFLDTSKCELCGSEENLDVHHKDGNWQKNEVDNLQVLCRSCHMKIHRPKPICQVDGCCDTVKGYGYCEKHYRRFKKYGNPLMVHGKVEV